MSAIGNAIGDAIVAYRAAAQTAFMASRPKPGLYSPAELAQAAHHALGGGLGGGLGIYATRQNPRWIGHGGMVCGGTSQRGSRVSWSPAGGFGGDSGPIGFVLVNGAWKKLLSVRMF